MPQLYTFEECDKLLRHYESLILGKTISGPVRSTARKLMTIPEINKGCSIIVMCEPVPELDICICPMIPLDQVAKRLGLPCPLQFLRS